MRISSLVFAVVLMSAITLKAQDTAPQNPPPVAQSQGTMKPGMPEHKCSCGMHGMGGMHEMGGMHQQHLKEMQANLDKMHALLKDMSTKAASLTPKDKAAMMDNIEMWQIVVDHFDHMMKHMQEMPSDMGHRMHHEGMMGEGKGQSNAPPSGGETVPPPAK